MPDFFLKKTSGQKPEAKLMRKWNTFVLIRVHASFQRQLNKFRAEGFVSFFVLLPLLIPIVLI